MFGNASETEQTYIETITLRDAIPASKLDFNALGMIMQSIGIFYDNQQAKENEEMAERLKRLGLDSGMQLRMLLCCVCPVAFRSEAPPTHPLTRACCVPVAGRRRCYKRGRVADCGDRRVAAIEGREAHPLVAQS